MAMAAKNAFPVAVHITSATPHEIKLVEETLAHRLVDALPEHLIGDKADDSDALDEMLLEECGMELIAPNRANRRKSQDGRSLRRYRRRWKVERFFSWLQNYRHIRVRDDVNSANYLATIHLAISIMYLRLIVGLPL